MWCSLFFNPDLSLAPSKTPKMTPHLPSLFNVQGNGVWPPFDLHLYRKWPQFDLVWVKMVTWWHWNVQSSQTTLECWILKVLESIYDFGGHGGQMEVKNHFPEHLTMKASGVSFLGFFRVLNSNPGWKTMNTTLEVTYEKKVEVKVTSILTILVWGAI